MNLDDKFKLFLDVTSSDAGAKSAMEVSEYREKMAESFEEYKKSEEDRASSKYENSLVSASSKKSADVTKYIAAKRKELQDRQKELRAQLIGEVRTMLIEYKNTDDYMVYLKSCINKAEKIADETHFSVYIDKSDEAYLKSLESLTKAEVLISDEPIIGGIRAEIPAKNIILDESFATKLDEEEAKIIF